MRRVHRGLFCVPLLLLLGACDSPPAASTLVDWSPKDHDRSEVTARAEQPQAPGGREAPAPKSGPRASSTPNAVVEATWVQQCATCHGALGHGDGPTGPMVHAADLTLPDWQASVTDEQIASSIANGKGKMPRFSLPEKVVAGLVARIRATKGR